MPHYREDLCRTSTRRLVDELHMAKACLDHLRLPDLDPNTLHNFRPHHQCLHARLCGVRFWTLAGSQV